MFTGYCDKLLAIFFVVNRLSFVSFVAAKSWQFSIRNKFFAAFRLINNKSRARYLLPLAFKIQTCPSD
jgi:hypothetical protein